MRFKPFPYALLLAAASGAYGLNLIIKERFDRGINEWTLLGSEASVAWDRTEGWLSPGSLRLTSSTSGGMREVAGRCYKLTPGEVRATGQVKAPNPESRVHCFVAPISFMGDDCTGERTGIAHQGIIPLHTGEWEESAHGHNPGYYLSVRVHLSMLSREAGNVCLFDDVILRIGEGPAEIPSLGQIGAVLLSLSLLIFAIATIHTAKRQQ